MVRRRQDRPRRGPTREERRTGRHAGAAPLIIHEKIYVDRRGYAPSPWCGHPVKPGKPEHEGDCINVNWARCETCGMSGGTTSWNKPAIIETTENKFLASKQREFLKVSDKVREALHLYAQLLDTITTQNDKRGRELSDATIRLIDEMSEKENLQYRMGAIQIRNVWVKAER